MAECNKDLQAAHTAYPRTCAVCGRGPCTKYPNPADPQSKGKIFIVVNCDTENKVATFDEERARMLATFGNGNVEEVQIL